MNNTQVMGAGYILKLTQYFENNFYLGVNESAHARRRRADYI